jgi:peptidyl-prolyl cis-trans isomerase D
MALMQSMHDVFKGWIAYLVLGAVAATFVLWGINWTLATPTYAAKVNGREIAAIEVRESYQRQLAQYQRAANGTVDDAQRALLKRRVLDDFVTSEALITRVDDLGYRVSDADLLKAMAQIPAFQVDGKFDLTHAIAVLKAQGRSIPEIESLIRRQVQLEQLDAAMRASSFATGTEVKRLRSLTGQQRDLGWVLMPAARYAAEATPDAAAVQAYYDAHKGQYMTPEIVTLRYLEIDAAALAAKVAVTDDQLRSLFEQQKAKNPEGYNQPEQRRVRHILIAVNKPQDDAAAKAKAESLLKRAQAGEDFSALAKQLSQDPGSASQGGDLGWSERKVWVAPFADAAFGMQVNEIRGPVKTQFGYHILRLDGIQPATQKTFEQSKSDLEAEYRRTESERQFNALQDQLADAALQNGSDIEVVARKTGLPVQQIADFSRTDGGASLGNAPKVLEAAFSQDVLDGHLSPIVEVSKGRGVVLHASDHKLPQQKPLEAVRSEIVAAWKKQRGSELAKAAAEDAVKRLRVGESWDAVAKTEGGTAQAPQYVGRSDHAVPGEISVAAFEAPRPAEKPQFQAVSLASGDAAALGVLAVREDPSSDAAQQTTSMRRQYAQELASTEAQGYAEAARASAQIVLNPQAID